MLVQIEEVKRVAGSRYKAAGEEGSRVGCQVLALDEARVWGCVQART